MRRKINVVLGEDHPGVLHGIEIFLDSTENVKVVGTARDGAGLLEIVEQTKPDVVCTDLMMSHVYGIKLIRELIASVCPNIVVYSFCNSGNIVGAVFQAGATGFVNKSSGMNELHSAIEDCFEQRPYVCSYTVKEMRGNIHNLMASEAFIKPMFTELELQIVDLICQEKTSEEIAKILFKSKKYIDRARSVIFEKMQVKSGVGVAMYAAQNLFISKAHPGFIS